MSVSRRVQPATWMALALGLAVGIGSANFSRTPLAHASGGDRLGVSVLSSGPVEVSHHEGLKIEISTDAIYFLDWKAGKLLAALPSPKKTGTANKILGPIAERDLITDFAIAPGQTPQFLMTTAHLGTYDSTGSRLFVLESNSRQMAVYSVKREITAGNSAPKFELLEKTNFGVGADH
jgi:hypothetical protein